MNYLDLITKKQECGWAEVNGMNCRTMYHVGENFIIEIILSAHDRNDKNDIANLWKKYDYTDRFMNTHIGVQTYYTDIDGKCSGLYNIQHKMDGCRPVIDFEWILEATPENVNRLLKECIRMREMDIRK